VAADPAVAGQEDGATVTVGGTFTADDTTTITSTGGNGFAGITEANEYSGLFGQDLSPGGSNGVAGVSNAGIGVSGKSIDVSQIARPPAGVLGDSTWNDGVVGLSLHESGIYGVSGAQSGLLGTNKAGVIGDNKTLDGIVGLSAGTNGVKGVTNANGGNGVLGEDESTGGGTGVSGTSNVAAGVRGQTGGRSGMTTFTQPPGGWTVPITGAGVIGDTNSKIGVIGLSSSGYGVMGITSAQGSNGIVGLDQSTAGSGSSGCCGNSERGIGVLGQSGVTSGLLDGAAPAVLGDSYSHDGVIGLSGTADGVRGTTSGNGRSGVIGVDLSSGGGYGVVGLSSIVNGVGIRAIAEQGTALEVEGTASFSQSGTLTVPAGQSSYTISFVGLTKSSFVLATLQNYVSGLAVAAAVPDATANTIEIYLTEAVPTGKSAVVCWFVLN
jgi:hypothetical protein